MLNLEPNGQLPGKTGICDEDFHRPVNSQERGQINFPNYAESVRLLRDIIPSSSLAIFSSSIQNLTFKIVSERTFRSETN